MKNKMIRLIGVFVLFALCSVPTFGNQSMKINVNGQNIDLGGWLVSDNGISYVPVSVVSNLFTGKNLT